MRFSAFAPFGHLKFAGGEPLSKRIYDAIWANLGSNYAKDGYTDAKVFATAKMLARVALTTERLGAQIDPARCLELLAAREREHGIVVPASATLAERRETLAAQMRLPAGNTLPNVLQALTDLLGADFVSITPTPVADVVTYPSDPSAGPGNFVDKRVPKKLFKLRDDASAHLGGSWNYVYLNLDGSMPTEAEGLREGDWIVVDGGHNTQAERVQVEDEIGGGSERAVALTLTKAHDPGALIHTGPWPYWLSNRRYNVVKLSADAASDAETRRQVDALLGKLLRAVSTWNLQGSDGPFLIESSPLDVTPFGG